VRQASDLAVRRARRFTGESFLSGVALSFAAKQCRGERTFIDGADWFAQDHLAAPQNRDLVGDAEGFAETMRDENDASAAIREFSKPREQFRGFRGCEDRRRLIEQKRSRVSRECFDDLEALLRIGRRAVGGALGSSQTGPSPEHRGTAAARRPRVRSETFSATVIMARS
jgi:hypothetical protein